MNHLCQFRLLLFFFFFDFRTFVTTDFAPICDYAFKKCPGQFLGNSGYVRSQDPPIAKLPRRQISDCENACIFHEDCWYIEMDHNHCLLFNNRSRAIVQDDKRFFEQWICCRESDVCRSPLHRCRGYWWRRHQVFWRGPRVLQNIKGISDSTTCRSACNSNPLCGSINFQWYQTNDKLIYGYCELLAYYISPIAVNDSHSSVFEWHCCRHSDNDLPTFFSEKEGKCRGRWEPRNVTLKIYNDIIGTVFMISKVDCMGACDKNPFCKSVLFSQVKAICLPRGNNPNRLHSCKSYNTINVTGDSWYGYKWTCQNPKERVLQPFDSEPAHFKAQCVCLNVSALRPTLLATDGCIRPLTQHNITLVSSMAAFWLRERREVTQNGLKWTRVFNGETYVWLSRPISQLLTNECHKHHCDVYSTVIDPNGSCPPIVTRPNWYAQPPLANLTKFATLPNLVVIFNTECPEAGCFSNLACSDYMRQYQRYQESNNGKVDIIYNFVVSGSAVFEGRGADFVGQHTTGYNPVSLGIGMIGWFDAHPPAVTSLRAVRQLIRCLVKQRKLAPNYRLVPFQLLRPRRRPVPGKQLLELLPNWSHYYSKINKKTLPAGLPCDEIFAQQKLKIVIIVSLSSVIGFIAIITGVVYGIHFQHTLWCPVRRHGLCVRNKRHPNILCCVGHRKAFAKHTKLWPANCIIRKSATLQVNPLSTQLYILQEIGRDPCQCFAFSQLLWTRCSSESIFEFPSLLKNSLALNSCQCFRILVWGDSLYLLLVHQLSVARKVVDYLQRAQCLCNGALVHGYFYEAVKLERLKEFSQEQSSFDVSRISELPRHRSIANLCRFFEMNVPHVSREVTYAEFCEEGGMLELADILDNESSSGSRETLLREELE